jgi:hypothetical protein
MVELCPFQPTGPILNTSLRGFLNHAGAGLRQADQIFQGVFMEGERNGIGGSSAAPSRRGEIDVLLESRTTEHEPHASKQGDAAAYSPYCE